MLRMIRLPVLLVLIAVSIISCAQETIVEEYSDLSAAMVSGAAGARGWVPGFVPASATNLKIAYNIETNEVWLIFEADSKDLTRILMDCPTSKAHLSPLPRTSPPVSWWPKSLTSTSSEKKGIWNLFMCKSQGAGAIDLANRKAYYWRLE